MIDHEAILARKLAKMFPDPAIRLLVEQELNRYGLEEYGSGWARVQLAILKVAGTSIEKIEYWTDAAKRDFRDVLAAAEYPNELLTPTWELSASECKAIRDMDAEQYHRWLEE